MGQEKETTDWHRLFGLMLEDFFIDSPFEVEQEIDLSRKQQFLDLIILRKKPGRMVGRLPDGLEPLADYNLLTYKSLHEPLDAWALDELLGHLVNYRKQISPSMNNLLPREQFRLLGISTRFPEKLRNEAAQNEVPWEEKQSGVYEVRWGTHRVRILVLSEMPDAQQNDLWELFSGVPEKVTLGAQRYRPRQQDISSVIQDLLERYQLEGVTMPYTLQDFTRDFVRRHLDELTPEELLERVPLEKRLEGLSVEELEAYIRQRKQGEHLPWES